MEVVNSFHTCSIKILNDLLLKCWAKNLQKKKTTTTSTASNNDQSWALEQIIVAINFSKYANNDLWFGPKFQGYQNPTMISSLSINKTVLVLRIIELKKCQNLLNKLHSPATRRMGCLSGWSSICLAIHDPSKCAYHHPFFLFCGSLYWSPGRTKGMRK